MNRAIRTLAFAAGLALPAAALADTISVPGDFESISDAVEAAAAGDVILVAKGTYPESVLVAGKQDIEIRGKGNPVIQAPDGQAGITFQGSRGILLTGFTVEGGEPGLRITGGQDLVLSKITVVGAVGGGFLFSGGRNLEVTSCRVEGAGGAGMSFEAPVKLVLAKCVVEGAEADGIFVTGAAAGPDGGDAAVLTGNSVSGTVGAGISYVGGRVLLEKSKVADVEGDGITVLTDEGAGATVSKNRVDRPGGAGIRTEGDGAAVVKNRVSGAGSNGFSVQGSGALLEKNQATTGTVGFALAGSGEHVAAKNKVKTTSGNAFNVTSPGNTLEGNAATAPGGDGFFVTTSGNTFTANKAKGAGGAGLHSLQSAEANTFDRNRFGTEQFPE
ncbi:MAG: right-handed parallel beta-helix repeat-containing protein [Planctomycetaceae bacterium]|nr:right-handed parallel beta-helix repeat-containing protein [Planctomycetota bacterium]NUN53918.1 right-handed parallel beta-helix repeat-containing protein [Planctomycetaceae bacterium]